MDTVAGPAPDTPYARMIGTLRHFLDAMSCSDADVATMEDLTASMSCWIDRLERFSTVMNRWGIPTVRDF